jgi:hypothetical protein
LANMAAIGNSCFTLFSISISFIIHVAFKKVRVVLLFWSWWCYRYSRWMDISFRHFLFSLNISYKTMIFFQKILQKALFHKF